MCPAAISLGRPDLCVCPPGLLAHALRFWHLCSHWLSPSSRQGPLGASCLTTVAALQLQLPPQPLPPVRVPLLPPLPLPPQPPALLLPPLPQRPLLLVRTLRLLQRQRPPLLA